jgi:hypothetical protein
MSPPTKRHVRRPAASPNVSVADGLRKLGKSENEIIALLHSMPSPWHGNIGIGFPGFEFWIDDFGGPTSRHLHAALFGALHQYQQARKKYEHDVRQQMGMFRRYRTAQAVLAEINASRSRSVIIMPYRDDDQNADAGATHVTHRQDVVPLGMTVLDSDGAVIKMRGKALKGTGTGADVTVDYTPSMWGPGSKTRGPASDPDEVLLHELIHASRQVKGVSRRREVDGGYDNEEEFIAIMIDNIYLSEKGRTRLRGTHQSNAKGNHDTLVYPEGFLDNKQGLSGLPPYRIIEFLRFRQPALYAALAAIQKGNGPGHANFNPIRDWEQRRKNVLIDL